MIRITVVRDGYVTYSGRTVLPKTTKHVFQNDPDAAKWLVEDSYFAEPFVARVVWERLP